MHRKLKFTVAEDGARWRTHRIMEICEFLTSQVLEPMFTREGAKWTGRFLDCFTFDNTCNPLEPTGTIRFAVPPMFSGRTIELQTAIQNELGKLGIKTGPLRYERESKAVPPRAILIPITENPTAAAAPPDVNMSHTRGCLVMRDLLGYQRVNGRYEFTADDLVKRLAQVTDEKISACTASPVKGAEGVRRTPSAVSMKAIRRCLDEVKQFGTWAQTHQHQRLVAA